MAKRSLPGFELSSNDIQSLAQIIQCRLDFYNERVSPFQQDYMRALRTVVGLGFAAIFVEDYGCAFYQGHLRALIGALEESSYVPSQISYSVSQMVGLAVPAFQSLGYPPYFEDFKAMLTYLLDVMKLHGIGKSEYAKEAERLLGIIVQR